MGPPPLGVGTSYDGIVVVLEHSTAQLLPLFLLGQCVPLGFRIRAGLIKGETLIGTQLVAGPSDRGGVPV